MTPKRIGGFLLAQDDDSRARLPSDLRLYGELYAVTVGRVVVGVTDEYGTCHWAAEGWTLKLVEDLLLNEDGSWRESAVSDMVRAE